MVPILLHLVAPKRNLETSAMHIMMNMMNHRRGKYKKQDGVTNYQTQNTRQSNGQQMDGGTKREKAYLRLNQH